jgi:hypothetical protein
MHAMLAAQAFTPHTAGTAKITIVLIAAAIMIFRQRLLYVAAYGIIVLFAVALIVGVVAIAQLM